MPSSEPSVEVFADRESLVHAAAESFAREAADAIAMSGRFVVALAGGSTPEDVYRLLATPRFASRIDWGRVRVYFGDERCVGPEDPASNFRMAHAALLSRVPIPAAQVHRIRGEEPPDLAAAAYEALLRAEFHAADGPPPATEGQRFDLVLLGLGSDGHTASLFPGTSAVRERSRWVAHVSVAAPIGTRITLTPSVINAAAAVTFLVYGADKAPAVRRVLERPSRPDDPPARSIAPAGRLSWLLDEAAASKLSGFGD